MTDAARISLIIQEGEGLTVEFKEHFSSRIAEDMPAFANTKGGMIILGVRDDKTIIGEKLTNDLKARITSLARNCTPPLQVKVKQIQNVVTIDVSEGEEKPYGCSSGYFRRLDGATQKMTNHELRIMFREHDIVRFEEKTVNGFSFNDISMKKVRAFVKEAGIKIGNITAADFLRSLKVADRTTVKIAGILFFARDPYEHLHQAQLTLLGFKGTKKLHIYDRRDIRDDLLTQFNEAILFLEKHLNVRSEIKGINRVDIYEIPFDAIREAIVNALMHRDYSIAGSQVSVEVYDDRVEITNPGGLPPGLTKKAFGTISIRRNERISDLFFRLHKVERVGMGIQRMRETMEAAGLREPAFETDGFFRTILYRPDLKDREDAERKILGTEVTDRVTEKVTEKVTDRVTENQLLILQEMKKDKNMTAKRLSEIVGISERKIKENIKVLKNRRLLKRIGPDRGGHWEVTQ